MTCYYFKFGKSIVDVVVVVDAVVVVVVAAANTKKNDSDEIALTELHDKEKYFQVFLQINFY
jgi:hypothetical protein